MTIRTKQRLTLVALLAFAIWPLAHRGLVAQYGITPWKFMGFAMYCLPGVEPRVEIHVHYGERRAVVDPTEAHMRDVRREVARFVIFRRVWGELLTPQRVGEVVSGILTRADKVEVAVTEGYLDPDSWRLAARETIYEYHPPAPPEVSETRPMNRGKRAAWAERAKQPDMRRKQRK